MADDHHRPPEPTVTADATPQAGRATKPALLAAPLCVLAGIGALVWFFTAESAHADAQKAACGDLPQNSAAMYAAAWSALALGLLAHAVLWPVVARARARGARLLRTRAGAAAAATVLGGLLPLLLQAFVVYALYQPDPGGGFSCAG